MLLGLIEPDVFQMLQLHKQVNVTSNYMRLLALFILQAFFLANACAQKVDSIKYSNGYLYFHQYGKGELFLLLTGGPGANYQQLEDVAITLGKRYRIILPEQRGTGNSIPQPFDTSTINLSSAQSDIKLLLDHLKLKQIHFMGHSWGAMLSMSFASKYPSYVKSLILFDPGPFKLDQSSLDIYSANTDVRLAEQEKKARDSVLKRMQSIDATKEDSTQYYKWELVPIIYDRSKVDSLIHIINKGGLNPKMGGLIFHSLFQNGFDLSGKLPYFNKPVHVITGRQHPLAYVSYELKILLPKAHLHWINKSGHFPMYEQSEKFYRVLFKIINPK